MKDIETKEDIQLFVNEFYAKVQKDNLLAPVFALRIQNWQPHLERMYRFWNTVLFFQRDYKGNPFSKHIGLPVDARHFQQWVTLFCTTIDNHFEGVKAEEVKQRAARMAALFNSKLNHLKENSRYKSIM